MKEVQDRPLQALVEKNSKRAILVGEPEFVTELGKMFQNFDVVEIGSVGASTFRGVHNSETFHASTVSLCKKGEFSSSYHLITRLDNISLEDFVKEM